MIDIELHSRRAGLQGRDRQVVAGDVVQLSGHAASLGAQHARLLESVACVGVIHFGTQDVGPTACAGQSGRAGRDRAQQRGGGDEITGLHRVERRSRHRGQDDDHERRYPRPALPPEHPCGHRRSHDRDAGAGVGAQQGVRRCPAERAGERSGLRKAPA